MAFSTSFAVFNGIFSPKFSSMPVMNAPQFVLQLCSLGGYWRVIPLVAILGL
jgi:hypothetical protein